MTRQNNSHPWDVNTLRVTVFPGTSFSDDPKTYWPPDFEISSLTNQPKKLESLIQGTYKDKQLSLTHMPLKLDLYLTAPIEDLLKTQSFPVMGNFDEILVDFTQLAESWLMQPNLSPLKRIAFGADLVRNVTSLEEGYKQISSYLPIEVKYNEITDFQLQLNKPIQSKTHSDLEINRLSIWNVLTANLKYSSVSEPSSVFTVPDKYYCHVSLDINTSQKYDKLFDLEKSLKIFQELTKQALDISKKGVK